MAEQFHTFLKALSCALKETNLDGVCLKPKQMEILFQFFNGRNALGVLPTDYGKSLIFYLLPDLMKFKSQGKHDKNDAASQHTDSQTEEDRAVLVISPLNALIQNQINRLQELGLSCIFVRRTPHYTSASVRGSSSSKVQYPGVVDDHDQSTSAQDIVYDYDYCQAEDLKLLKEESFKFIIIAELWQQLLMRHISSKNGKP